MIESELEKQLILHRLSYHMSMACIQSSLISLHLAFLVLFPRFILYLHVQLFAYNVYYCIYSMNDREPAHFFLS